MSERFAKKLLYPGKGIAPTFVKNSKAVFHFRTIKPPVSTDALTLGSLPEGAVVIDDSRTMGNGPFELLIGREFKLSIWEELVKSMTIGEVARFVCPFKEVFEYPRVSKALRDMAKHKAGQQVDRTIHHQCSFAALQGTGHKDLDQLGEACLPLMFELELLKVEQPGDYQKDHWAMSEQEKNEAIPKLKQEGNALYKEGKVKEAAEKYFEALSYLEEMCIKEKPHSEQWNEITERKVPFLLNYAQCKLLMCEYAEVIQHTSDVLEFDGDNVKALFRRAKAHSACWNANEAREDFERVLKLDPSLEKTADKELKSLGVRLREKAQEERKQYKGKLFT